MSCPSCVAVRDGDLLPVDVVFVSGSQPAQTTIRCTMKSLAKTGGWPKAFDAPADAHTGADNTGQKFWDSASRMSRSQGRGECLHHRRYTLVEQAGDEYPDLTGISKLYGNGEFQFFTSEGLYTEEQKKDDADEDNFNNEKSRLGPGATHPASELLSKFATIRNLERLSRFRNAPIIFVVSESGASIVTSALQLANRRLYQQTQEEDFKAPISEFNSTPDLTSILLSTYGIIMVRTPLSLLFRIGFSIYTMMFLFSEWSLCNTLHNYEIGPRPPVPNFPARYLAFLNPLLQQVANPSTLFFLFIASLFSAVSTMHYAIFSRDKLQKYIVGVAVVVSLAINLPNLGNLKEGERPILVSKLAQSIWLALGASAIGHAVWRICRESRQTRVERKIKEWAEKAKEMEREGGHVVRFAEIE